jgi:hypothetical protein
VITLAIDDVSKVTEALERYRGACERLERDCEDGIAWLRAQVDARRSKRREH